VMIGGRSITQPRQHVTPLKLLTAPVRNYIIIIIIIIIIYIINVIVIFAAFN